MEVMQVFLPAIITEAAGIYCIRVMFRVVAFVIRKPMILDHAEDPSVLHRPYLICCHHWLFVKQTVFASQFL